MAYGYPPPGALVTGEAVELELRPARLGSRTVAFILDVIAQGLLIFVATLVYGLVGLNLDSDLATGLGLVLYLLVLVGYPVILETLWRGRTLGKAALGLRVVRDDGGPAPFTAILIRELVGFILEKPGITMGLLGVVTMVSSQHAKRLGDMLGGTLVVTERIPGNESAPVTMPPPLAAWAAGADLSRVPDSLALSIRQFLGRAGDLNPQARDHLGNQLAQQTALITSPPPPPGTPGWAFLMAVVAERRRREELRLGPRPPQPTSYGQPPPVSYGQPPPYGQPAPAQQPPPPPPPGPGGFTAPT